jgi:MFS family permease
MTIVIFGVGQYFILRLTKRKYGENTVGKKLKPNTIDKIVSAIQYLLLAILVSVILQMLLNNSYNIFSLLAVIWITYGLAMVMLGFLSQRFLSWFTSNHNSVVLLYALASLMLLINAGATLLYMTGEFENKPVNIRPIKSLTGALSSAETTLASLYFLTSVLSFILTWVATVILLKHYSRRLGSAKYWIIVSIPLAYFLSQFQTLFLDVFTPFRLSDPILFGIVYTLIFSAAKPAGGILFGVAFWIIARNLSRSAIKDYMIISAYGMILLFTSNQPIGLLLVPYPPFGLATISFMGLASYLIFVGIYSAAVSVSEDTKLRQSIRKIAINESKLLDSIGSS